MQIETKFLGNMMIDPTTIIEFPAGLPAFEEEKQFVIIPLAPNSPFVILQSMNTPAVGFIAAYPFDFKADYSFELEESEKERLKIIDDEDVVVYSIITLNDSLENSTMNLLAPVIINSKEKIAKQIILHDNEQHPLHYPLKSREGSVL